MAVPNQEAKTRQLAVSQAPVEKRQCGKCPFAKENGYNLVERPLVLVDREGKAHTLHGYVREGGNWLDGMLSILKQNGAAAEKIYLPGCGWGISAAVLRDGTLIQNPHGYFDGMLPVATMGSDKTELNFANIRIGNQSVLIKDETPKCPVGNSLVNTEGLVFGKGEYGEMDPNSGTISWGSINIPGASMRPLLGRAPSYLLPQIEQGLVVLPNPMAGFQQNPLVGARGYDAIAFRKMEIRENHSYSGQDTVECAASAMAPAPLAQEFFAQPLVQAGNLPAQEIRIERIEIIKVRKEPERREEIKCAEEKPAVVEMRHSLPAELPAQEARIELSFKENVVWKADAPREERKPEERRDAEGKRTGKKELPAQTNVKRADIPVDPSPFIMHDARTQRSGRRADLANWKVWLPEMPKRMKRRKAKADELPKEFGQNKRAPGEARKGRRKVISEIDPGDAKEMPGKRKARKQNVLATEMKVAKAKRAKEKREKKFTEELRTRKTEQKKRIKEKRAGMAAERRKRSNYAEKYLLTKKAGKQKIRNWISISRR